MKKIVAQNFFTQKLYYILDLSFIAYQTPFCHPLVELRRHSLNTTTNIARDMTNRAELFYEFHCLHRIIAAEALKLFDIVIISIIFSN